MTKFKFQARFVCLSLLLALVAINFIGCKNSKWFGKKKTDDYTMPDILLPPPPDVSPLPAENGASSEMSDGSLREIRPVDVPGDNVVAELQTVFFDYDSYELSPRTLEALEQNAQWLKSNPSVRVQIEGHCDERGSVEYNINLGGRRASRVREYLARLGVDPGRMTTISYGKERPLNPGHDEAAWAMNRRAQFLVY
jgi:peptidoglycan-associated lipoprotein